MVLVTGAFVFRYVDWGKLLSALEGLNAPLLIALMALLPLGGFSISIVYLLAGARFGPWVGAALVAALTAFHLLASHAIAHGFFRLRLERWFERHRRRIPKIPPMDDAAVAALTALVPGPPYFLRNYFLALADVPLRIYFWICLPIYTLRAGVVLFLGDLTTDPSGRGLTILVAIYAVKLALCAEAIRRIRRHHHGATKAVALK